MVCVATNEDVALFRHTLRGVLFYWGWNMKRIICALCLLILLLFVCFATDLISWRDYSHGIYQLTFKTRQISNDHIGNDWSFTYTYNSQIIQSGYTITQSLEIFTFRSISVEVRENDKIDDVGTGLLSVAICDDSSAKTKVTVTETNGRYTGNHAVWEITCEVKLIDKQ